MGFVKLSALFFHVSLVVLLAHGMPLWMYFCGLALVPSPVDVDKLLGD